MAEAWRSRNVFTATQFIAVDRVAFSWQARFPILGPLALSVVDEYDAGAGQLAVRLLGVPLQRDRGPETVVGEALRYLAELPFAPPALECNPQLAWAQLDGQRVEVATNVSGQRLAVTAEFDEDGNIACTSSQMRKLKLAGEWRPTPWGGEFRDYAQVGALYLPMACEAHWDLDEGRYVYWRGAIVGAELVDRPFERSR